jgi:hypothetical protein
MATTLTSIRAEKTNVALLTFSDDLDAVSIEGASGTLVAGDGGSVPTLLRFAAVDGQPTQVRALFSTTFRAVALTFTFTGLVDWAGAAVSSHGHFTGITPSSPRRLPVDQRLRIDFALEATPGGDVALLCGDAWMKEQAIRWVAWQKGTLQADPSWGFPVPLKGPLGASSVTDARRRLERGLAALPGVLACKASLAVKAGQQANMEIQLRTDQSPDGVELSYQRQLGR